MIHWGREKRRKWQRRSKLQQVEVSTYWLLLLSPWIFYVSGMPQFAVQVAGPPPAAVLEGAVVVLGLLQCLLGVRGLRRGIDTYLGTGQAPPRRLLVAGLVTFLLTTALVTVLIAQGWVANDNPAPTMALFAGLPSLTGVYGLTVSRRRSAAVTAGGCVLVTAAFAAVGTTWPTLLGTLFVLAVGGLVGIFSPRCSAWYLAVMRELDEARETQSRLAVAEERLRFSRDLHDVMGRNLSVIALKSELATQLAHRGAASAAEQMREVQELARQAQTEVRAVVRGYRETGLETELAGARAVLRAAGVDCRIESAQPGLASGAQAALGWVVREGATNVLRHAEASCCVIRLTRDAAGATALVMENDGLRPDPADGGSGLTGLRERLAAVDGTLTAERDETARVFRLRAEIPASGPRRPQPPPGAPDGSDDADGSGSSGAPGGPGAGPTPEEAGARAAGFAPAAVGEGTGPARGENDG
ncbi:sensor histidine kinase [Streptomyces qinglanensis]|uniref:Two-component system, NarL family, sensor histidine kinase DesK n=1 Tax=Streptomyces qinglanensis TaxID=943816 RepID=A0A1H9PN02_9ACTN|nr:histidine kinase [Streptomyces qinglanensis]SER49582.1 two-component system, NarL family, sensor histidine kinase DesK [Streptomyces qinglanensis]